MNTKNNNIEVPEGYWQDAQGRLVPVEQIREIDRERDALVQEIIAGAEDVAGHISDFKKRTMADIQAFAELSAEKYNAKLGGKIGNITLTSFNGRYKVVRSIDERQTFDERLQAAKALLDEYLTELTSGSSPELRALINDVFQVDKLGRLNINRILSLRRLDIHDERWCNAMKAISESLQVVGTKAYIRIYERQADGSYKPMPLDVAA